MNLQFYSSRNKVDLKEINENLLRSIFRTLCDTSGPGNIEKESTERWSEPEAQGFAG